MPYENTSAMGRVTGSDNRGLKFGVYELANGCFLKTSRNFNRMRRAIEKSSPSRWDNLVVVVLPRRFNKNFDEMDDAGYDIFPGGIEKWIVAVPQSGFGYGSRYIDVVNKNRRKFRLPGSFKQSEETKSVFEFKKRIFSSDPHKNFFGMVNNYELLTGGGNPEDPDALKESSRKIHKLIKDQDSAKMRADEIVKGIE